MTLHAPPHHFSLADHRLLRDLLVASLLAIGTLLVLGVAAAVRPALPQWGVTQPETPPLVQFRAAERTDFTAGRTTEGQSILVFREAERSER